MKEMKHRIVQKGRRGEGPRKAGIQGKADAEAERSTSRTTDMPRYGNRSVQQATTRKSRTAKRKKEDKGKTEKGKGNIPDPQGAHADKSLHEGPLLAL